MLQTERMPDLVEVMRMGKDHRLKHRQLPLQVDENLTLVMDLSNEDLVQEVKQVPPLKLQSLDSFVKKYRMLNKRELQDVLKVSIKEILDIMSESIDCVGCRRSAEKLFGEMAKLGQNALFPLVVVNNNFISIRYEFYDEERCMFNLLQNTNGNRLSSIASSRRQSKKSKRCVYHSLESQRLVRPMASGWQDIWRHMTEPCRDEIVLIEASSLLSTLDNYLRKHRFCGDCRTKVMKAYALLIEEEDPSKEKGYIEELYAGIKRCVGDKHVHLDTDINYIGALISRAEPELMGNRRERHAKTIEIAQEEVLTCLGICVYERLHRIQLRIREEQYTCQVLAAAAIDGLARRFETAIEVKQGFTKLDQFYNEFSKKEKKTQKRKRLRKQKRSQKKETLPSLVICCDADDCSCVDVDEEEIDFGEDDIDFVDDVDDEDDDYDGVHSDEREDSDENCNHVDTKCTCENIQLIERVRKQLKLSGDRKKSVSTPIKPCSCVECNSKGTRKSKKKKGSGEKEKRNKKKQSKNSKKNTKKIKKSPVQLQSQVQETNVYDLIEDEEDDDIEIEDMTDRHSADEHQSEGGDCKSSVINHDLPGSCSSCPSLCDHSQDYGYASAENNNHSNSTSSPDGSDVACSEGFCNHSGDVPPLKIKCYSDMGTLSCKSLPLQQLLIEELEKNAIVVDDTIIPSEEVEMYKVCAMLVNEKRLKLRETLKSGFANLKDPQSL
ncbi:gametogenetin-binding protein 2-like [Acyrthosiphon pisum]|uniref:Gametogenetin-binding protein 2-like n=1 Tax=Acyrthosiphon pisum TaxID=7029 RepID=A0A8R1ZZM8_ACYPI|nr:gametogenetin-binding protein 2-like [Acyrthosiphon pisum]|eukprot:XP_001942849.3 PREDICTED: gametogenetin-binding protein 2-like [Acyrthosiphon pisum]